jgi:hypothetical protein
MKSIKEFFLNETERLTKLAQEKNDFLSVKFLD